MSLTFSNSEELSRFRNFLIEISLLFKLSFIHFDGNKCFLFQMKAKLF